MFPAETPILSGFFATQTTVFHYAKTQMQNRRFPFVERLEPRKLNNQHIRQVEIKYLPAFFVARKRRKRLCFKKN